MKMLTEIAGDRELPPCFSVECLNDYCADDGSGQLHKCGWKGRLAPYGFMYLRSCWVDIQSPSLRIGCPKCHKNYKLKWGLDKESFVQRFRWFAANGGIQNRNMLGWSDTIEFPCKCPTKPPCSLIGNQKFRISTMGDTCFCNDEIWIVVQSKVKCNACYEEGEYNMLEKHPGSVYYEIMKLPLERF